MKDTLVFFDVGGVLLELNYTGLYEKGAELTNTTKEEFKKLYNESGLELKTLNGSISDEEYQTGLKQLLNKNNMSRTELEDFVKTCWGTEITPVIDLKEKIYFNSNAYVGIFSNINQFAYEYLSRVYPRMFQTFNPEITPICSYILRGVKPKFPMYFNAESLAIKMDCENTILIEDKPSYIQFGIDEYGWKGIYFTPYVDKNEAIRHEHGQNKKIKETENLKIADSIDEIEDALRYFGVKF